MPETEDKPDLDALLELLGEPDEAPRHRKRLPGSVWLMAALVLSMAGIWLAAKVATREIIPKSTAAPVLPTKAGDRRPREENAGVAGAVDDYIARCKKGMTAREVRWIVEDFQKAGLDQGLRSAPPDEFVRQRKAQHAWYLDLLVDGLNLDSEQRTTAEGKLAGLLDESAAAFRAAIAEQAGGPFEHKGRRPHVVPAEVVGKLINAGQWLTDERYAPWELCELTDEQKRATYHGYLTHYRDDSRQWFSPDGFGCTDPKEEHEGNIGDFPTGEAPAIGEASAILPFYSYQSFAVAPGAGRPVPLGEQAKRCHPAQLKTLLLVKPDAASRLLEAVDAAED